MANITNFATVPLPVTREDLLARKTMASQPTLNDHVDEVFSVLWVHDELGEQFRAFCIAGADDEAVEGSTRADDQEAARMIRQFASDHGNKYLAAKNLTTLARALHVVARRYHMTRREMAERIGGEVEPDSGDNASDAA